MRHDEAAPGARRKALRRALAAALAGLFAAGAFAAAADAPVPPPSAPAEAASAGQQDFSQAERLLFMNDPLARLKPPTTLRYHFHKAGTLEGGFDDEVTMQLSAEENGSCCAVSGEFLTGERRLNLPTIEHADANPVLLYFLERDVREMKRLTKGAENYYRKRIRMAVYNGARVEELPLSYKGRQLRGQQVLVSPYDDDPARSRFEKFARKTYEFYLSDEVPGGVYGIRSVMRDASDAAGPMVLEELFLDGASPTTGRSGR